MATSLEARLARELPGYARRVVGALEESSGKGMAGIGTR